MEALFPLALESCLEREEDLTAQLRRRQDQQCLDVGNPFVQVAIDKDFPV